MLQRCQSERSPAQSRFTRTQPTPDPACHPSPFLPPAVDVIPGRSEVVDENQPFCVVVGLSSLSVWWWV